MKSWFTILFSTFCITSSRRLNANKDECHTDLSCYVQNQSIAVSFTASDAIMQTWIGIYPEMEEVKDDLNISPLHSVWACSDCDTPHEVTFHIDLEPGTYVAQSHGIGHFGQTTFSQSKSFVVKAFGEKCNENMGTNLRAATAYARM
mmetsp:Transcript_132162/g.196925  ORF Transcript_132162/g.196925 Transcript_132162/m.196925 type:complete len:147 (-) Transcript_132162:103-543(-)|eukprot:CAMPEP_0117010414 /NCGR_PEP_ID=MMETSP0472-20121206/9183_1 /TAXON_ID=693140 ORGANISM="Tiarina fusus, Strain LIS" /NCGR_SAMPLE_ID=MMETSP0472 /ASSEMBLY_ACC=CAM_ASM_000603 /LENGTH=146 /DNA_ID=CAMNT_0004712937 /DNA_START=77 /DNA_END=517 /DNA_ORIENTATION=+